MPETYLRLIHILLPSDDGCAAHSHHSAFLAWCVHNAQFMVGGSGNMATWFMVKHSVPTKTNGFQTKSCFQGSHLQRVERLFSNLESHCGSRTKRVCVCACVVCVYVGELRVDG